MGTPSVYFLIVQRCLNSFQMIHSCTVIASNLLLVDEIMRAGLSSLKGGPQWRHVGWMAGPGWNNSLIIHYLLFTSKQNALTLIDTDALIKIFVFSFLIEFSFNRCNYLFMCLNFFFSPIKHFESCHRAIRQGLQERLLVIKSIQKERPKL